MELLATAGLDSLVSAGTLPYAHRLLLRAAVDCKPGCLLNSACKPIISFSTNALQHTLHYVHRLLLRAAVDYKLGLLLDSAFEPITYFSTNLCNLELCYLQIMSWCCTLGIQIFLPLTVLGCVMCELPTCHAPAHRMLQCLSWARHADSQAEPAQATYHSWLQLVRCWRCPELHLPLPAVLPVNLTQSRTARLANSGSAASTSKFQELTLSNIQRGSALYW